MSPAALTTATRSALGALVEREERRTGSRTVAYEIVAKSVGASSSWIRKFLAKSEEVKEPRLTLFQNIRANYDDLCRLFEMEKANELLKQEKLRGELHAASSSFNRLVDSETRT